MQGWIAPHPVVNNSLWIFLVVDSMTIRIPSLS